VLRTLLTPAALLLALAVPACAATLGERTLAKGNHGADVVTLQRVLAMKGYSVGPADGIFGRMTKLAVKRFQKRKGLAADGRVGPLTTHALAYSWDIRTATLYGPGLWGNRTACGYTLGHRTRGIAHRTLPCGTPVPVYFGGRLAIFPVIDRGPYTDGVSIDLTAAAARKLGMTTTSPVRAGY
jgi:peptidoglycan hydrolase-like protein with peptidoglycan-binding domain